MARLDFRTNPCSFFLQLQYASSSLQPRPFLFRSATRYFWLLTLNTASVLIDIVNSGCENLKGIKVRFRGGAIANRPESYVQLLHRLKKDIYDLGQGSHPSFSWRSLDEEIIPRYCPNIAHRGQALFTDEIPVLGMRSINDLINSNWKNAPYHST